MTDKLYEVDANEVLFNELKINVPQEEEFYVLSGIVQNDMTVPESELRHWNADFERYLKSEGWRLEKLKTLRVEIIKHVVKKKKE